MKKGDTIFVGQYLFTGSETTSVWLEVKTNSEAYRWSFGGLSMLKSLKRMEFMCCKTNLPNEPAG